MNLHFPRTEKEEFRSGLPCTKLENSVKFPFDR